MLKIKEIVIGELKPEILNHIPKNPHIAKISTQMGRSEELGTGIKNVFQYNKIYSNVENNRFIDDDIFITEVPLKIFNENINGELNERQLLVYNKIKNQPNIKVRYLSEKLNIPFSTIDKYIRVFLKMNLIERRGSKKTGGYYVKK